VIPVSLFRACTPVAWTIDYDLVQNRVHTTLIPNIHTSAHSVAMQTQSSLLCDQISCLPSGEVLPSDVPFRLCPVRCAWLQGSCSCSCSGCYHVDCAADTDGPYFCSCSCSACMSGTYSCSLGCGSGCGFGGIWSQACTACTDVLMCMAGG